MAAIPGYCHTPTSRVAPREIRNPHPPQKTPVEMGQTTMLRCNGDKRQSVADLLASQLGGLLGGLLAGLVGGLLPGLGGGLLGGLQHGLQATLQEGLLEGLLDGRQGGLRDQQ